MLGTWRPSANEPARKDFPERLAQWLHVSDAITLRTMQQRVAQAKCTAVDTTMTSASELNRSVDQLRSTLASAVNDELQRLLRESRETGVDPDPDVELALHQQVFDDMQRRMEMSVDALRIHVRQCLSRHGESMARLATMDAALDQMLAGREQEALSTRVPALLRQRFEQLRRQHAEREAAAQVELPLASTPESSASPHFSRDAGHWLPQYSLSLQSVLLAELEHRLQPVIGMVEALGQTSS
ncbi:DUF3348 domain-containing protein [Hydrogenophaga sp. 5NK40-0174]